MSALRLSIEHCLNNFPNFRANLNIFIEQFRLTVIAWFDIVENV